MNIAEFGVRKPVAANLLMVAIVVSGLVLGLGLRREFFPEIRPNQVVVTAPYPGASPDEIERALAIKIEDRLETLDDVEEINTIIVEGAATVRIEFTDVDIDDAVARVKREVDALQDLPENSERIVVTEFEPNIPVISLTLYGQADERTMKSIVQRMRDDLRSLPDMGDVTISGVRRDEIAVELEQAALLEHGLSLPAVTQRVREAMTEVPGGAVRTGASNVALRTIVTEERADEVRDIVVKAPAEGRPVRLDEIAEVSESFADVDLRTRFNDEACASLTIYATGDQDVIEIADKVKAYTSGRLREPVEASLTERVRSWFASDGDLATASPRLAAHALGTSRSALPNGVSLALHNDLARFVDGRLSLLSRNAFWGGVLVFGVLMLLLARRVALWVTAGLLISLLGTLAVMAILDISLNFLTMFGLIVVLGLLVDDAIVVAENISARHEKGEPALTAAINGAKQVSWPVTATVITTIVAFLPLRLLEGRIGDMMGALPIVVACALGVSLVESLFVLPAHMGHSLAGAERRAARRRAERGESDRPPLRERLFKQHTIPVYERLLDFCLRRRYLTVAFAVGTLTATLGLVAGGRLPFTFLASADSEFVVADVTMPVGSSISRTDEAVSRLEEAALANPDVDTVFTLIGARQNLEGGDGAQQSHIGQLYIELLPIQERDTPSDRVIEAIRRAAGPIPAAERVRFEEAQGGPGGPEISLAVAGVSLDRLSPVVDRLKDALKEYTGVYGVADDADAGQRELRIELREGASELGFTVQNLARQMRGAVFGLEAYTFAGEREDVDVRVMLERGVRRSLASVESMWVFTPAGDPVPLSEVAKITEGEGFATIRRLNRERAITVSADVDQKIVSPEEVTASLAPLLGELQRESPDVEIIPRGRQEDLADSFRTLPLGMAAAVLMIYVTLAWLFQSYVQPLAILLAVPFASAGAIIGHILMGYDATILSLIGYVALTGIVVNDSLIFMEFYNDRRRHHESMLHALLATGRARFRAIILTTVTTVLGLSPLMLEQSFQARFLIPMAITVSFGLIAATGVTLILLPVLILIADDIKRAVLWLWTGGAPQPRTVAGTQSSG